jgi:hypothetical protein
MKILLYSKLTQTQHDQFFKFLKTASTDTRSPAHVNMWSSDWEQRNDTIPYILKYVDRFNSPKGEFHLVLDGEEVVACAGVYKSDFNPDISLAGVRAWINRNYRNKSIIRDIILPHHKQWSIDNGCKAIALSFNEYNKNLIEPFKRIRLGENSQRLSQRQPHHLFYTGLHEVGYPVAIQYTPQWVIYEKLDPEWSYDWGIISTTK